MKSLLRFCSILLAAGTVLHQSASAETPTPAAARPGTDIRIVIKTTKGDIEATIFASKAPMTSANFLNLAKRGFYEGVAFHRVIEGFMAQGGDPTGTGTGSPGYRFADEFSPELRHDRAGILSMANAGPGPDGKGTNGSQFFLTYVPTPMLNDRHSVFGVVTKGLDAALALVGKNNTGEPRVRFDGKGDKIEKIEILDSTDALFAAQAENLAKWNASLKK